MYAKLFSSIAESSLWSESKEVRLLFVTILAKANQVGFVEASLPGLARLANLTLEETASALEVLKAPDKYSKNPDHEGRRVIEVPGGYMLINYEDYRARRSEEERREYMREYMKEYRQGVRKQSVNSCKQMLTAVSHSKPPLAQAEAEAEAEEKTSASTKQTIYSTEFERFWQAFPKTRRTKKKEAYKRWKTAVSSVSAELLIEKARRYSESEKGKGEFAVMPSVFLNCGMWEDDEASWGKTIEQPKLLTRRSVNAPGA